MSGAMNIGDSASTTAGVGSGAEVASLLELTLAPWLTSATVGSLGCAGLLNEDDIREERPPRGIVGQNGRRLTG
jgi:hypothetical protein